MALFALSTGNAFACACGCGVFSVGTSSLFPNGSGGTAFLEYDYMNQDRNWDGSSSAPLAQNDDKNIRTDFYTVGARYMFNRDWGLSVEVPYWDRLFITTLDSGGTGGFHHAALGDIRLLGMYTGFSADLSSGLLFGLKLPTGDYTYPNFDRDTSIGTGSTDAIVGAYHEAALDAAHTWNWFVQGQWQQALVTRGGYRPGNELDAAGGIYYNGWEIGSKSQLSPVMQMIVSSRASDSGAEASPDNSGYNRLLIAPGLEFDSGAFRLYADIELPVYQHVTGNQLVATRQYKLVLSYKF
ncbi:MAG: hypothetical protein ACRETO_10085 [Gammaproteobacteria bacterium]